MSFDIPRELVSVKNWTHSFSGRELKRPHHSHFTPGGSLSFIDAMAVAKERDLLVGFYVTEEDDYIIGDIDHVDKPDDKEFLMGILPVGLADILFNKDVYSEVSVSGKGLRFIAKLPPGVKETLRGRSYKNKVDMGFSKYDKNKKGQPCKREAQLGIGRPWYTISGNRTSYAGAGIVQLELEDLEPIFKIKHLDDDLIADVGYLEYQSNEELPPLERMIDLIRALPFDQNPRIQRAFFRVFGEEYDNYQYWLKVMMAVSDYSAKLGNVVHSMNLLEELLAWSATDPEGYTGPEPIMTKWESFSKVQSEISHHTVQALVYYSTLIFPVKRPLTAKQEKEGCNPNQPLVTEYANFKAMLDYYDIKLFRDANAPHKMYLTGDDDILHKYFRHLDVKKYHGKYHGIFVERTLTPMFHMMCQDHGFIGISHMHIKQDVSNLITRIRRSIDLVKLYFETPFAKLPESLKENALSFSQSTPEVMFKCLTINHLTKDKARENSLYLKYYKAWLMGIARNVFFPGELHMNNCVLCLTGPEQIRKTSHFKHMLPSFMRDERIAFTTHGFSNESAVRDVTKLSATNNLVVWDEIEQFLNHETESNFKKLIDNNPVKLIDKYEVVESYIKPIAIYGATSNQKKFSLSDNGSRRMFIIPVLWVDTDTLMKINWWPVINNLRDEIQQSSDPPWLLTSDELDYQAELHQLVTAKAGMDIILGEMFEFTSKFPVRDGDIELTGFDFYRNDQLHSTKAIIQQMNIHCGGPQNFSRPAVINSLQRMCGRWSKTHKKARHFETPLISVNQGEVTYSGRTKWWLPPIKLKILGEYE